MSVSSGTTVSLPAPAEAAVSSDLPGHFVRMPGTNWALWRTVAVRGAGFPAAIMDGLAAKESTVAGDRYLASRARATRLTDSTMRRAMLDLRGARDFRKRLRHLHAAIVAGNAELAPGNVNIEEAAKACADAEMARQAFLDAFLADENTINKRLAELAHEPRFREAMLWQNLASTRRVCHELRPDSRAGRRRSALRHIAMRAQRYCAKNDSIGFFGPVAWAAIEQNAGRLEIEPGPALIAHREVFFEGWSIDALAESLDSEELRPWIAPRVKAGIWVHGGRAYRPHRKEVLLSQDEKVVLSQCDGRRTAREVAQAVLAQPPLSGLGSEREVFEVLEKLVASGLIAWRLEVASQLHPESELASCFARIGDPQLRTSCEAALSELLSARDHVAAAAGNEQAVDAALGALDTTFTRLTDRPSSRRGGQTYAGRTLVYEDCRRDCQIRIGTNLIEDLAPAMGVVLDASRWAAAEVGEVIGRQMRTLLAELREKWQGEQIDCHTFSEYVISDVWPSQKSATLFDASHDRFREMWNRVLGRPSQSSSGRAIYPVDEVRKRAASVFPLREVGWSSARYISPDLMISAASAEALRRGEYSGILGEIHCGNSLTTFVRLQSDPHYLSRVIAADTRGEFVVNRQRPKTHWLARTNNAVVPETHWRYLFGDDPPIHPLCRPLPAGMLLVTDTGSSVKVRARDGSLEFDAIELFGPALLDEATRFMADFRPRLPHMPRLSLGKLIVARERWNFSTAEMAFLKEVDAAQQFLDVRAWGLARGMPRRVFVSSPVEKKPWFLDFDSPVSTAIFSSLMKNVPEGVIVGISEMLPDFSDLWLTDRDGQRFTSELRLVARLVSEF